MSKIVLKYITLLTTFVLLITGCRKNDLIELDLDYNPAENNMYAPALLVDSAISSSRYNKFWFSENPDYLFEPGVNYRVLAYADDELVGTLDYGNLVFTHLFSQRHKLYTYKFKVLFDNETQNIFTEPIEIYVP